MRSVPLTRAGLREICVEPVIAIEECPTCRTIPAHCRRFEKDGEVVKDDIPATVEALRQLIGIGGTGLSVLECTICGRLYRHESDFEIDAGFAATTRYDRVDLAELLRVEYAVRLRVSDERLYALEGKWMYARQGEGAVGQALTTALPDVPLRPRELAHVKVQDVFPDHTIACVTCGGDVTVWVALGDDDSITVLTGNLAAIPLGDPPPEPCERDRAVRYGELVDEITSESRHRQLRVEAFDDIPWRAELTGDERAQIEDLRLASRVEPPYVEVHADGVRMRFWVVSEQKLICRVLTVRATGVVTREDAVVGEAIPTYLGKRWSWNEARKRAEPVE